MSNLVIFQMLRNLTKYLVFVFLCLLFGCQTEQTHPIISKPNVCQYSQYLKIWPSAHGFRVSIQHPDHPDQVRSFTIEKIKQRIAVLSSTHVGMLSALQAQEKICAIPDLEYLFDGKLKKLVATKRVQDLRVGSAEISAISILKSKPDVLVYSGFGLEDQKFKRLKAAGVLTIANYEWREQTPLARAEWVLLFGVLTGKFQQAKALHEQIVKRYNQLKLMAKTHNKSNQLPVAISGNLYGDQWIAPAGNSYEATLLKDAGIAYVFSSERGSGSCFKSIATVLKKAPLINIWLNPGLPTKDQILTSNPKAKFYPFFKRPIYCYTAYSTNKCWELSVIHPDWLLSDYIRIAQHKQNKLHFYAMLK